MGLGQPCLLAHACHAGGELFDVACTSRRVLREFVDNGGSGQHRAFEAEALVFLEEHGQFAHVLYRPGSEVVTEGHIDFVGGFDKVKNLLLGGDAKFARVPSQGIELLAGGARVHRFEAFVEGVHVLGGKPGVLAHLCLCFFDVGVVADSLLEDGTHAADHLEESLHVHHQAHPLVAPLCQTVAPRRLLRSA